MLLSGSGQACEEEEPSLLRVLSTMALLWKYMLDCGLADEEEKPRELKECGLLGVFPDLGWGLLSVDVWQILVVPTEVAASVEPVLGAGVCVGAQFEPPA